MFGFQLLTKDSGCGIYLKDEQVIVKQQPALWIPTARFVLLLTAGIPLIFGVVSLISHFQGSDLSLTISLVFIIIGTLFGFIYVLINRYSKKINALSPSEYKTICTFDLKNAALLDGAGNTLDSLGNISVEREFQLTSSSKKLVVRYSSGSIILVKGNPFAGGTASLENVFRKLGLMK